MSKPRRKSDASSRADYKSDLKPVWCAGCGDFGALAALHRAMAELQLEPGTPSSSRHRLLLAAARLRRDVRLQRRPRPGAPARDRRQGLAPGAQGHRRRRRRRRDRDRRQPFPSLRAPQPRHRVPPDGQRDLRPHQGPGRAHDAHRRQDEVHVLGQPRSPPSTRASSRSPSARRGSGAASRAT